MAKNCARCNKKLGLFNRYYSEIGTVCSDCSIALTREANEHKLQEKQKFLEQVTVPCPICQTNVTSNVWETGSGFTSSDTTTCTTCGASLKRIANQFHVAQTGIVIGLYVFAVLTMIFGCVLGFVTIFVWAIETGYRTGIQLPTLFVSGCSIILFSLVAGMILIALGKMVDNSDIQKYYTIAQAKRNIVSNESKNESSQQEKEV